MDLQRFTAVLRKWGWLLVLSTVLASGVAYWYSSRLPKVYRASATLMVGQVLQRANPAAQDFATGERLAQTYAIMVRRQPVLEATVQALGLNLSWQSLVGMVHADSVAGTQLIAIGVLGSDPATARTIANEVARQLLRYSPTTGDDALQPRRTFVRQQLTELETRIQSAEREIQGLEAKLAGENSARNIDDIQTQIAAQQQKLTLWRTTYSNLLTYDGDNSTNKLSVIEWATVSDNPVSPNIPSNMMMAAAIGLLLAVGATLLMEYLDDTIKTQEDVSRLLMLPVLGLCSKIKNIRKPIDHLVTLRAPSCPEAEAFRLVATHLRFSRLAGPGSALLVTSAGPAEGKTIVASNLAIALAESGKRVILCDADLRKPAVHRYFGLSGTVGLTSLIAYDALSPEVALLKGPIPGLRILPCGSLPLNPVDVLSSDDMRRRVDQLKELADVIIFDSPPILAVADTSIIAAFCNRAILVTGAGQTRRNAVQHAKAMLDQNGIAISGVVLNKISTGQAGYYRYYGPSDADREGVNKRRRLTSAS